ncbi:MAG TPA: glycosyltransferase family 4 protein [bacterium]|nr:glycosyltransferase family 4 protein [bacterium]
MKLAYIVNARIPTEKAHGYQICKMCEAFAKNGVNVDLIVPNRANEIKDNLFEYYGILKNFNIIKIPTFDIIFLGKIGFLIQRLSFIIFVKIYILFKKYDILYTRDEFLGLLFKNFILEVHALPIKINSINLFFLKKVRKFIVLTQYIKNDLINTGIDKNNILIASDCVDIKDFENINYSKDVIREKLKLPVDKKIILYAGSFYLYDWKGVDLILEASMLFGDDFLFVLIGGNKEEIDDILKLYKNKNLLLIEKQKHEEIPFYLKAADVLVLPNKKGDITSEKYTSPLKLFEYMASGTPIIASDLDSIKEILSDNNSFIFPANDFNALANGLNFLFNNKDYASKLSINALLDAKKYTWDSRVVAINNFIK